MDGRHPQAPNGVHSSFVLGAVGRVREISQSSHPVWLLAHSHRHPELAAFTQSLDCVLLEVVVEAYQVVHGIDEVSWWCVDDLK